MHTTACSAEGNWTKWGLVYAKNIAKLLCRKAECAIHQESHFLTLIFLMDHIGVEVEKDDQGMLDAANFGLWGVTCSHAYSRAMKLRKTKLCTIIGIQILYIRDNRFHHHSLLVLCTPQRPCPTALASNPT